MAERDLSRYRIMASYVLKLFKEILQLQDTLTKHQGRSQMTNRYVYKEKKQISGQGKSTSGEFNQKFREAERVLKYNVHST